MRTKPLVKRHLFGWIWECEPCRTESAMIWWTQKHGFSAATDHAQHCLESCLAANEPLTRGIALASTLSSDWLGIIPALEIEHHYQRARGLGLTHNEVIEVFNTAKQAAHDSNSSLIEMIEMCVRMIALDEIPKGKVTLLDQLPNLENQHDLQ